MNLTKAEAMKAVIDGIPIQFAYPQSLDKWCDAFGHHTNSPYTLLQKLTSIDSVKNLTFRLKPTPKTISYRCFMHERGDKTIKVGVWWCEDEVSQAELEQSLGFVKWLGDTIEAEI